MIKSERQFAKFLSSQGKKWKAQPHLFKIGDGSYRPDFYCYDDGFYYEVKTNNDRPGLMKVMRFRECYPELKIKVVNPDGSPYYRPGTAPYFQHLQKIMTIFASKDITELTDEECRYLKKCAPKIWGTRMPTFDLRLHPRIGFPEKKEEK